MEVKTKSNNRLWQARHRIGLEQKQVAHLLGHKTCDQISRYERGTRTPSFKTALKLEIIYRTPLRKLFPEHQEKYQTDIASKSVYFQGSLPAIEEFCNENVGACTYQDLLNQTNLSPEDVDAARKHAVKLHERIAEAVYRYRVQNREADI